MEDLTLEIRGGLPDALRVLVAEYPRDGWEQDPGFDGLIRFWLDRHIMFRRLMDEMRRETEDLIDRKVEPDRFAAKLSRYGGMFVNQLHEHHTIEDTYYFPQLAQRDARIESGFAILEKDHHAIDTHLALFVEGANGLIEARDDRDKLQKRAGAFQMDLIRLEGLLDRHLLDEEELIVPVILKYGMDAPE